MRSSALLLTMASLALFLPFIQTQAKSTRPDEAPARPSTTPDSLSSLSPEMGGAQRRRALEELASTPRGAAALVAAFNEAHLSRDELDSPLVEKLQAVLKNDTGLKELLDSMSGLLRQVLVLDGQSGSFADGGITLDGPFTVETWIKLGPGIGGEGSLLGAPGVFDINFRDSRLRVRAGGGPDDAIVATTPMTPGAWTHVAVTRDSSGRFKLYLDGVLDQAEGSLDPRRYENLAIGRGASATLAEFRIWRTCLSRFTILAQFDRTGLEPPPAFYRPLDAPWESLRGGARVVRAMDFPPLVSPGAARALDAKFAQYRALARRSGGDPARGQAVAALCTACHKIRGEGAMIGPDLSNVGAMGTEIILRSILTPNAAISPDYRLFRVELTDGNIKEGFLAREETGTIVLRVPGVEDARIPPDQVRKSGFIHRSLMPEGLEATFTPGQWTDLMAYLLSLK